VICNRTRQRIACLVMISGFVLACGFVPVLQQATAPAPVAMPDLATGSPLPPASPTPVQTLFGITVEGALPNAYRPLAIEQCALLGGAIEQVIHTPVRLEEKVSYTDPLTRESGKACRVHASGSGGDVSSVADAYARLKAVLEAAGWTEVPPYLAGSSTGVTGGFFRQGSAIADIAVSWQPAPDAICPTDQPVSECTLKPEQMVYNLTIYLAQK
jgi:hypothetical protein